MVFYGILGLDAGGNPGQGCLPEEIGYAELSGLYAGGKEIHTTIGDHAGRRETI